VCVAKIAALKWREHVHLHLPQQHLAAAWLYSWPGKKMVLAGHAGDG
jgi:hypothetical protein